MYNFKLPFYMSFALKGSDTPKNQREMHSLMIDNSCTPAESLLLIVELRKKILTFRDMIDLPPCDDHGSINELVIGTVRDLHKLYPKVVPRISMSEIEGGSTHQVLSKLYKALTSIGDSWVNNHKWLSKFMIEDHGDMKKISLAQLGDSVLSKLDYMIMVAREMFDVMDESGSKSDDSPRNSGFGGDYLDDSCSESKSSLCLSPVTPTSVLPDFSPSFADVSYSPPLLWPLRLQAVGKLKPFDVKRLSFHMFPNVTSAESSPENVRKRIDEVEPEKKRAKGSSESVIRIPQAPPLPPRKSHSKPAQREPNVSAQWSPVMQKMLSEDSSNQYVEPPPSSGMLLQLVSAPSFSTADLILPDVSEMEATSPSTKALSTFVPLPPPPPPLPPMVAKNARITNSSICPKQATAVPEPPPPPPMLQKSHAAPPSILTQNSSIPPPPTLILPAHAFVSPPPTPATFPTVTSMSDHIASKAPLPPQPMVQTKVSTTPAPPPPPPMMQTKASVTPPPPPPPMMQTKGSTAPLLPMMQTNTPPPPPPVLPSRGTAPLPPPPPMVKPNGSSAPPPPPPMFPSKGGPPPPPMPLANGSAPPPPPPGAGRSLRPLKAKTKLKRSSQMGNLYRVLKGKVEGTSQNSKASNGKKSVGASAGGSKQSMADALAEMTKRSSYFQQIEEDVQTHAKMVMEMKTAITSFQTTDMAELQKFHQHVESHLEKLTDETQVLARFEDFPTKKLEGLRTAAALYSKLDAMVISLTTWKIEAPVAGLLDRVENYFNKIKGEVDTLDRTKDDETKRFQSQKITFDFHILVRIKEAMVDLSSSCMELALKERREAKAASDGVTESKSEKRLKACTKMLWRAFQLAFRVYTFAGGHDDRADMLSKELAQEIENDPHH
ncbi:hypothetical protein ACHQM5_003035 [Ranunculus cassubicifolius]